MAQCYECAKLLKGNKGYIQRTFCSKGCFLVYKTRNEDSIKEHLLTDLGFSDFENFTPLADILC